MNRTWIATAIVALAAACTGAPPKPAAEQPPVPVSLATVQMTSLPSSFEAGGIVRSRSTSPVASRVMAPIESIPVHPGDVVRRGATLVVLDARQVQAGRSQAEAALRSANEMVRGADADVRAAEAGQRLAQTSFDRTRMLQQRRSATTEELERAQEALDRADAQLTAARAHSAAAVAAQEAARSGVDAAGVAFSYATLAAPFDGIITQRLVDPGSMAIPGAPLLTIEDPKTLRLEVALDEARAGGVTLRGTAESCFDDEPSQSSRRCLPGRVAEIGRLDPSSHSVVVKIDLSDAVGLRSGMFGRARFDGPSRQTITAPASAIVRRGQLAFAFTVDVESRARLQPLSLGESGGERVEVLSGLREGDRVVLDPSPAVSDGVTVTGGAR